MLSSKCKRGQSRRCAATDTHTAPDEGVSRAGCPSKAQTQSRRSCTPEARLLGPGHSGGRGRQRDPLYPEPRRAPGTVLSGPWVQSVPLGWEGAAAPRTRLHGAHVALQGRLPTGALPTLGGQGGAAAARIHTWGGATHPDPTGGTLQREKGGGVVEAGWVGVEMGQMCGHRETGIHLWPSPGQCEGRDVRKTEGAPSWQALQGPFTPAICSEQHCAHPR